NNAPTTPRRGLCTASSDGAPTPAASLSRAAPTWSYRQALPFRSMEIHDSLVVPQWVSAGIHARQPAVRDVIVCGADSETYEGEPMSLQFHSFDEPSFTGIYFVGPKNATNRFIRHLDKRCKAPYYRVYVHNLAFDLVEFFWQCKEKLITADGAFEFTIGAWTITGVYGRPTFCRLRREKPRCTVELVDSYLWF